MMFDHNDEVERVIFRHWRQTWDKIQGSMTGEWSLSEYAGRQSSKVCAHNSTGIASMQDERSVLISVSMA